MTEVTSAMIAYMQTYPIETAEFQAFPLPPEDIIEGDPKTEVAIHHESVDGSVLVGVSRFTTGKYKYRQTANEINYVTKGRMIISSDQDDQVIDCQAGSVTRLDKGVVYTKTVVEDYEEIFVMLNDAGVKM